jgi:hypothetical protein
MKKMPNNGWIVKVLYSSDPGFGAVINLTFGSKKGSFFHTARGWYTDDDFDYEAIIEGTFPDAFDVLYEGLRESDFEPGDDFSPGNGKTYTYLPQKNWIQV